MDNSKPAFPTAIDNSAVDSLSGELTKREWFAGMALQGLLTSEGSALIMPIGIQQMSKVAFDYADAMIKESEKK